MSGCCEGDCILVDHLTGEQDLFDALLREIQWHTVDLRGGPLPRLVAIQGNMSKGVPLYRFPTDNQPSMVPFTPTVKKVVKRVEKELGQHINHGLIQLYRDGHDYISEHSDKTLDIVPGTKVATVSFGAQRNMVLRTKQREPRQKQTVPLPNDSLFAFGLDTNRKWMHSIRQDKRADTAKSAHELAFEGQRISLTLRTIGTFKNENRIYGQGATIKAPPGALINNSEEEAGRLLGAFSTENHKWDLDWGTIYSEGFDVVK